MRHGEQQMRPRHPGQLAQRGVRIGQVLEDLGADHQVEAPSAKGAAVMSPSTARAKGLRSANAPRAAARPSRPVTCPSGSASNSHRVTWPSPHPASSTVRGASGLTSVSRRSRKRSSRRRSTPPAASYLAELSVFRPSPPGPRWGTGRAAPLSSCYPAASRSRPGKGRYGDRHGVVPEAPGKGALTGFRAGFEQPPIDLTVVIPAYNERPAIEPLLTELEHACGAAGAPYEVVFVDDGSTDGSAELLASLARRARARALLAASAQLREVGCAARRLRRQPRPDRRDDGR